MTYSLNQSGGIVRDSDGAVIPVDQSNSDYMAYIRWCLAGNQATPYQPPPPPEVDPPPPEPLDEMRTRLAADIDNQVANIYSIWARFQYEYLLREQAARDFKAAGYQGDPGVWITSFTDSSGMDNKSATDLIILQADTLHAAVQQFAALRMRKYEVLKAQTREDIQAVYDYITHAIQAIAATLS